MMKLQTPVCADITENIKINALICFICGNTVNKDGIIMVGTSTSSTGSSLPSILGALIGKEFVIVISDCDRVCRKCFSLLEELDELEHNSTIIKKTILDSLQYNYCIDVENFVEEKLSQKQVESLELSSDSSFVKENYSSEKSIEEGSKCSDICEKNSFCNISVKLDDSNLTNGVCENNRQIQGSPKCTVTSLDDYTSNGGDVMSRSAECESNEEMDVVNLEQTDEQLSKGICVFVTEETPKEEYSKLVESKPSIIENENLLRDGAKTDNHQFKAESISRSSTDNPDGIIQELENTNLIFKCFKCSFKSEYKIIVEKHVETHSESDVVQKTHNCNICDMPFLSSSILARHVQVHERSKGPVKCTVCGEECHDSLHLLYHHRNNHNINKQVSCVLCDQTFDSNKDLKNHTILVHPTDKTFVCGECGRAFRRRIQLENHKLYEHGNRECRFCGKHIVNSLKLRQHEHRHARIDMKKFECDECGRTFKSPGGLRVHKVSHTGEYKFFCEFCGRGFMSRVILEEHKGVHTKEERYVCDICGRKFVLYSTLHLHKQWHQNPFPFPCKLCDKKFRYRSERANHVRKSHTGEHPHKCPHCSAEFLRAAYLKRHLSFHTKEYPFNCEICKKGFDQKRALGRHLAKIHKDMSLVSTGQKKCQYKVALRPEEYPKNSE